MRQALLTTVTAALWVLHAVYAWRMYFRGPARMITLSRVMGPSIGDYVFLEDDCGPILSIGRVAFEDTFEEPATIYYCEDLVGCSTGLTLREAIEAYVMPAYIALHVPSLAREANALIEEIEALFS